MNVMLACKTGMLDSRHSENPAFHYTCQFASSTQVMSLKLQSTQKINGEAIFFVVMFICSWFPRFQPSFPQQTSEYAITIPNELHTD